MEVGEIMKCEEYNQKQLVEWREDVKKGVTNAVNNISVYVWLNNKGNFKRYGYVGKYIRGVVWAKTKKEVKEMLVKEGV